MEEITIGGIKSRIEYGLEHGEDRSSYYKDLGMDVMETSDHLSLEFSKLIMDDLAEDGADQLHVGNVKGQVLDQLGDAA